MAESDTRILAELFTSTHLQQLAWYGWSESLSASVYFLGHKGEISQDSLVADVLEAAFKTLFREYPIEYVYKACMLKKTIFGAFSPNTTALYMEFPVAEARADMLLVNGVATVFEVKTRFDDPNRLNVQLAEYYRCFKSVCVIVEEGQSERYLQELPAHVGITALTPRFSMSIKRKPKEISEKLDYTQMFALLHQKEHQHAVSDLDLDLPSIDPSIRYQVALEFFSTFSVEDAYNRVLKVLRSRQRTHDLANLCKRLPDSLHASAFSYRMRKKDWDNLVDVLSRPPRTAPERTANVFPIF